MEQSVDCQGWLVCLHVAFIAQCQVTTSCQTMPTDSRL